MTDPADFVLQPKTRRAIDVFFLVLPHVHAFDLAGPVQAFYETGAFSPGYRLHFCGPVSKVQSAQGFWVSDLEPLNQVPTDSVVLVPGTDSARLDELEIPFDWLSATAQRASLIGSICSGAFVLARAGLLEGKRCTTHWKVAARLAAEFPSAKVARDRLFVRDGKLITSAGISSGVDMALSIIEDNYGPLTTAKVAREMVIFLRRSGEERQRSIYLDYRTHLNPGVHRVQDWLVAHPEQRPTLEELAGIAGMSARNLTRVFRQATGITLKAFSHRLKLEVARNLLFNPDLTLEGIAEECGFQDPRQLRRLWRRSYGMAPAEWRRQQEGVR